MPGTSDKLFDNRIITISVKLPDPYDTLTIQEIAEQAGVDETAIHNLIFRSRRLAYIRIGHKQVVLRKDWEDFLLRERVATLDEISSEAKKEKP